MSQILLRLSSNNKIKNADDKDVSQIFDFFFVFFFIFMPLTPYYTIENFAVFIHDFIIFILQFCILLKKRKKVFDYKKEVFCIRHANDIFNRGKFRSKKLRRPMRPKMTRMPKKKSGKLWSISCKKKPQCSGWCTYILISKHC